MQTVTAVVPRDPETCWDLFTDVGQLTSWVPGLRQAEIITGTPAMPTEIHFEFGSLAYTLVYAYDKTKHEVRWQPKLGPREGVSGFVRFDVADGAGTLVTYGLEHGDARGEPERQLGDAQRLVEAFVARVRGV